MARYEMTNPITTPKNACSKYTRTCLDRGRGDVPNKVSNTLGIPSSKRVLIDTLTTTALLFSILTISSKWTLCSPAANAVCISTAGHMRQIYVDTKS